MISRRGKKVAAVVQTAVFVITSVSVAEASKPDCNQAALGPLVTVELPGHPFSIVPTHDGCWLFVSLTSEDPKSNGVALLRRSAGTITVERVYPIEGQKGRPAQRAGPSGMVMTHDGQLLIAANDDEVLFLDVQSGSPLPDRFQSATADSWNKAAVPVSVVSRKASLG